MADDRMKNDDLDKQLGGTEKQGGQQAPGRQPQDDEKFGQGQQRGGQQRGGGQGTPSRGLDENDESGQGRNIGNKPGSGQGGQNR
jgi:hypothetical protein